MPRKAPTPDTTSIAADGDPSPSLSDFEARLGDLEQAVEALESGDLPLEQALKQYESGMQLVQQCQAMLKQAELRIEALNDAEPDPDSPS